MRVSGVVTTTYPAQSTVERTVQLNATTAVPVVQGIKLKITKVSMWALTNESQTSTVSAVPVYEPYIGGHDLNGNEVTTAQQAAAIQNAYNT